jgi:hypothetical protein
MNGEVTDADLIRLAARHGRELTPRILKRWRMEGVLQRPRQVHVEGRRGSSSLYPPETVRQVESILALGERRFDELRFRLWWDGWWVAAERLLSTLETLLEEALAELRSLRAQHGSPEDAAEAVVLELRKSSSRNPILRLIRWQIQGTTYDLEAVVFAMVLLALGETPVWESPNVGLEDPEPDTKQLMFKALGFELANRTMNDDVYALDEIPGTFGWLMRAQVLPLDRLHGVLASAGPPELAQGRADARLIIEGLGTIAEAAEDLLGRGALGLGALTRIARDLPTRCALVALLIAIHRAATPEEQARLEELRQVVEEVGPLAREFLQLRKGGSGVT